MRCARIKVRELKMRCARNVCVCVCVCPRFIITGVCLLLALRFLQVFSGVAMTLDMDPWPKSGPKDAAPSKPLEPRGFMLPTEKVRAKKPLPQPQHLRNVKAKADAPAGHGGLRDGSMRPPEPKHPPRKAVGPAPSSSSSSSSAVPMAGGCIPSWRTRMQRLQETGVSATASAGHDRWKAVYSAVEFVGV